MMNDGLFVVESFSKHVFSGMVVLFVSNHYKGY